MLSPLLKSAVPIDTRLRVKAFLAEASCRLAPWNQRALLIDGEGVAPFRIGFLGWPSHLHAAAQLLRLGDELSTGPLGLAEARCNRTALICDGPVPGALRVPTQLRMVVPLDRPLDVITAHWKLRTRLRTLAEKCRVERIVDGRDVLRVNREMLARFALARHDRWAHVLPDADIARIAREGLLQLVIQHEEPIAAHLGMTYERRGRRCWSALRFGYPESVFSDQQRLSDANTINAYWAMRSAIESGHQVFDFGTATACPDGGLLQFKRRRSGVLSTFNCGSAFWVRLPRQGSDEFLWRWPLFSIDRSGVTLHLGIPSRVPPSEITARLKMLAYDGLAALRLHFGGEVDAAAEATARQVFPGPPQMIATVARSLADAAAN